MNKKTITNLLTRKHNDFLKSIKDERVREIEFRGQRIGDREWVYGYYVKCRGCHYILQNYNDNGYDERWDSSVWVEVVRETVGQFINKKDKNDKKIYVDDILQIETENHININVVCKFGIARRTMDTGWEVDIPSFYFLRGDGLKSFPIVKNWAGKHDLEIMKIIGTVHENPELLEER